MTGPDKSLILREDEVCLTAFQLIDLWQSGCRCPGRSAGLDVAITEKEQEAQAIVTALLVTAKCAVHDPEHGNADGVWDGGEIDGLMMTEIGGVQVVLPVFGEPRLVRRQSWFGKLLDRLRPARCTSR